MYSYFGRFILRTSYDGAYFSSVCWMLSARRILYLPNS